MASARDSRRQAPRLEQHDMPILRPAGRAGSASWLLVGERMWMRKAVSGTRRIDVLVREGDICHCTTIAGKDSQKEGLRCYWMSPQPVNPVTSISEFRISNYKLCAPRGKAWDPRKQSETRTPPLDSSSPENPALVRYFSKSVEQTLIRLSFLSGRRV